MYTHIQTETDVVVLNFKGYLFSVSVSAFCLLLGPIACLTERDRLIFHSKHWSKNNFSTYS